MEFQIKAKKSSLQTIEAHSFAVPNLSLQFPSHHRIIRQTTSPGGHSSGGTSLARSAFRTAADRTRKHKKSCAHECFNPLMPIVAFTQRSDKILILI